MKPRQMLSGFDKETYPKNWVPFLKGNQWNGKGEAAWKRTKAQRRGWGLRAKRVTWQTLGSQQLHGRRKEFLKTWDQRGKNVNILSQRQITKETPMRRHSFRQYLGVIIVWATRSRQGQKERSTGREEKQDREKIGKDKKCASGAARFGTGSRGKGGSSNCGKEEKVPPESLWGRRPSLPYVC